MTMILCLCIVLIFRVDFYDILKPSAKLVITSFCILVLQSANFLIVMTTSFVLVKKINSEDVTPEFLLQSYMSTALLFGGMYFTVYVIEGPTSFHLASTDLEGRNIAQLVFHFGGPPHLARYLLFCFQLSLIQAFVACCRRSHTAFACT
uniref:Uncharacterized protein n=2 Tax=Spongospora subterranea TaxID=70186 RepID=A0A0H5R8R8_9EUKA|eukprot:CRZ04764.1 hypothetical protein [Spongospora subterranea]